ncbi:MAG: hypothetical protein SPE18_06040 [Candidatus Limivicinus sp.]|nr:hypothetical protein [Candidatus Limivicinus sp.]
MPDNNRPPVNLEELLASLTSTAPDKQVEPDLNTLLASLSVDAQPVPETKKQIFDRANIDELMRDLLAIRAQLNLNTEVRADVEIHIAPRAEGEQDLLTLLNQ